MWDKYMNFLKILALWLAFSEATLFGMQRVVTSSICKNGSRFKTLAKFISTESNSGGRSQNREKIKAGLGFAAVWVGVPSALILFSQSDVYLDNLPEEEKKRDAQYFVIRNMLGNEDKKALIKFIYENTSLDLDIKNGNWPHILQRAVLLNRTDILDIIFKNKWADRNDLTLALRYLIFLPPLFKYYKVDPSELNAINLLIKYGADINHRCWPDGDLLYEARINLRYVETEEARHHWESVIKILKDNGAKEDIDLKSDAKRNTP